MTAHPGLLAAPPPLAGHHEETSAQTSIPDVAAGAAITSVTADASDLQPTATDSSHDETIAAVAGAATVEAKAADNTSASGQYKDFVGQTMDMAFGPDYRKNSPDFEAYEKVLVSQHILPELAFAESPKLNLSLGNGHSHAKGMLNQLNDRYFALKSQA